MSRQPAIYLIAICAIVVILATGCTQAQSDLSRDELPAKLLDALLEEMGYVSDIRVLKYITFENRNYVLYYNKVGQMDIEHLKHFWVKNDRVVLGGGAGNVITVTEDGPISSSLTIILSLGQGM